jgi:D-sedoheptulose 7-phosphate isomerase
MEARFGDYLDTFVGALRAMEVTAGGGQAISMDEGIARVHASLRRLPNGPNKIMFIGNGGSAGIAGHMAIDFTKNGGVRSVTFNDASSLTCLANDLGYDQVFAKQVEMQGLPGDVLVAISSSGESVNILRAAEAALAQKCDVVTLTGFRPGNSLRKLGTVNFFAASAVYGFVETAHQVILHAILDTAMGWTKDAAHVQPTQPMAAVS